MNKIDSNNYLVGHLQVPFPRVPLQDNGILATLRSGLWKHLSLEIIYFLFISFQHSSILCIHSWNIPRFLTFMMVDCFCLCLLGPLPMSRKATWLPRPGQKNLSNLSNVQEFDNFFEGLLLNSFHGFRHRGDICVKTCQFHKVKKQAITKFNLFCVTTVDSQSHSSQVTKNGNGPKRFHRFCFNLGPLQVLTWGGQRQNVKSQRRQVASSVSINNNHLELAV